MICIPKLVLEIQDLLLPATVLLPRLDDTSAMKTWRGRSLGCGTAPKLWPQSPNHTGSHWDPIVHAPPGVLRGSTTESQGMEQASWGGEFSNWNHMLYKCSPFNWRPDTHTQHLRYHCQLICHTGRQTQRPLHTITVEDPAHNDSHNQPHPIISRVITPFLEEECNSWLNNLALQARQAAKGRTYNYNTAIHCKCVIIKLAIPSDTNSDQAPTTSALKEVLD